jgi:hypothetical protein
VKVWKGNVANVAKFSSKNKGSTSILIWFGGKGRANVKIKTSVVFWAFVRNRLVATLTHVLFF